MPASVDTDTLDSADSDEVIALPDLVRQGCADKGLTAQDVIGLRRSIENVRARSVIRLAQSVLTESVPALVDAVHAGLDRSSNEVAAHTTVACRRGCSACCHARVEVSAPEAFRIAARVRARAEPRIATMLTRLREHAETAYSMAPWPDRPACPFLADGLCSIYDVRPSACRKAHSISSTACGEHHAEIPQSLQRVLDSTALITGAAEAVADSGLDRSTVEMTSAVAALLTDAAMEDRWYAGASIRQAWPPA